MQEAVSVRYSLTEENWTSIAFIQAKTRLRVVLSTFQIVQILVQSYFELVSSALAQEATEPVAELVAELVAQLAVELINNHLISVEQKR